MSGNRERFDSLYWVKQMISQPNTWVEFYRQPPPPGKWSDRYARNRANILRIYVGRKGLPVRIVAQRHTDGLIRCWGQWNEGQEKPLPPPKETGQEASSA